MKTRKDGLLTAGAILFVLNITASAFNYLCQLFLAHVLSVESFGTVSTIFSFMLIIAVPGTSLTMIVAKHFAGMDNKKGLFEKAIYMAKQIKAVTLLTIATFAILLLFWVPIGKILAINNTFILFLVCVLAAFGFYHPLYSGAFSGNRHFLLVGLYSLLIPLYKLSSVFVAKVSTKADFGRLYIILLVMILGTMLTALIGHWGMCGILGKIPLLKAGEIRGLFSSADFNTLILNICLMVYMNIDLLVVRYREINNESGLYSAVLMFGRIIYYFSTTLGTIILPAAADKKTSTVHKLKGLHKTLVLMIGFAFFCVIIINLFKVELIMLLYGRTYVQAAQYVKYVSIISVSLSICTILINYLVGLGKTKFVTAVMLTVCLSIIFLAACLSKINSVLLGIGICGIVSIIIIYAFVLFQSRQVS